MKCACSHYSIIKWIPRKPVWFLCDSEWTVGGECEDAWLSHLFLFGPVMNWQPVLTVPCLSLSESWNRLYHPLTPEPATLNRMK